MVKSFANILGKASREMHEAAYLLASLSLVAHLLAIVRDRLFTNMFGAGNVLDIYYSAFKIPDIIFVTMASLVAPSVLVPFVIHRLKDEKELRGMIDSIFTVFTIIVTTISIIAFVFTPTLLSILFPDLLLVNNIQFVWLTRIILLSPIILGISNLLGSIAQAEHRFLAYAISPVLYNAGIIFGILFLYPIWGIYGLGFGVILGAFLHMLIQVPYILSRSRIPRLTFSINFSAVKDIMKISLPRTATLAFSALAIAFVTALASRLSLGSVSIFSLAYNLQSVPLVLVGTSYSIAAFPILSEFWNSGLKSEFLNRVFGALRQLCLWLVPITFLLIVLRAQIVRVIYGSGNFNWDDTKLVSASLAIFVSSVLAQAIILLLVRAYYASGRTDKPLFVNATSSFFIVLFSYVFVIFYTKLDFLHDFLSFLFRVEDISGTAVLMLPLGFSFVTWLNAIYLLYIFSKDFGSLPKSFWTFIFQIFIASFAGSLVSYIFLNIFTLFFGEALTLISISLQGFIAGVLGLLTIWFMLKIMGNKDIDIIRRVLKIKSWHKPRVAGE